MLSRVGALLVICAAAWWAAAALGADPRATPRGEYDGAVTVSLTATYSATGVYDPANPGTERQTEKLQWDQSETVVVYGLDTGSPTFVVTSGPSLTVSGLITTAAAPPNQSLDCSGTLSARPGAPLSSLFASVLPGRGRREVNVGANFVPTGDYIQSTGSGACRADPGGGVGLSVGTESTKVVDAKTAAETPIATHTLSSPPETQTFTSGGPQSTPTVTSSFYASFTVGPSCPANARAAADATASMPAESCTACPNPVDDPLPGEAERRAYDIYHDRFFGGFAYPIFSVWAWS